MAMERGGECPRRQGVVDYGEAAAGTVAVNLPVNS
jgi:hypothetical protein